MDKKLYRILAFFLRVNETFVALKWVRDLNQKIMYFELKFIL